MASKILHKRKTSATGAPSTSDLDLGEIGINTYDGKLYIKKDGAGSAEIVDVTGSGGSSITTGTSVPTDPAPAEGDAFYDTDDKIFRIYSSGAWKTLGFVDSEQIAFFRYTSTANQTTFTGNDANSSALKYLANSIVVHLNGVQLVDPTDYTATNGTSIVLTEGAAANDVLQVTAFAKFLGTGDNTVDSFNGDGSDTTFTLSVEPTTENNTLVYISGVYQQKGTYAVSGTTLTFSEAPPTGTANIEVVISSSQISSTTPLSSLSVSGAATIGGALTVSGTSTFAGGTITLGDADTDNVVLAADVNSNIIPNTDNTYDLGTSSKEWRNLYIDGTGNIDTVTTAALTATTADINGGTWDGGAINAATIGASSPTTGVFSTLTATTFTVPTAAQANITSLGTLSTLAVSGAATVGGTLGVTGVTTLSSNLNFSGSSSSYPRLSRSGTSVQVELADASDWGNFKTGGLTTYGASVFNENSVDADFRVESNGNANMLFVDGGANRVGIGTATPSATLQIAGAPSDTVGNVLVSLKDSGNAIEFGLRLDATSKDLHLDRYYSSAWQSTPVMSFDRSTGNVGIGTTVPAATLQVGLNPDSANTAASLVHLLSATASSTVNAFSTLKLDYTAGSNPSTAGAQIMFNQGYHSGNTDYTQPVGAIRGWKTGPDTNYGGGLQFLYQPDSAALGVLVGITMTGAGNVGVGHTTPDAKLHVGGAVIIDPSTAAYSEGLRINRSSNNYSTIHLGGAIGSSSGTGTGQWKLALNGNDFYIYETTTQAQGIYIKSGGKVGIGTIAPQNELDVHAAAGGNLRLSTGETTIVDTDHLGGISFSGMDSLASTKQGAFIAGKAAGTWSSNVYPTDLVFYTAATADVVERMRIDSAGNVGIGTTAPSTLLHLSKGTTGSAGGGDAGITMTNKYDSPDNSWAITPQRTGVSNTGLEIRDVTDSRTDMSFDGAGKVGIGVTAPNYPLDVSGANIINGASDATVGILDTASAGAGTGGGIAFGGYSNGTGSLINQFAGLQGIKENGTAGNYASALIFWTRANGASPVEHMRISSAGNVTLGGSNTYVPDQIIFTDDTDTMIRRRTSNDIEFRCANQDVLLISATRTAVETGFFGVGQVAPNQIFEVKKAGGGKIRISETDYKYVEIAGYAEGSANGSTMVFSTVEAGGSTLTERMRINHGGDVSIGTTAPKATFHVKPAANAWEDGLLIEHNSGNSGWNIHPENNSDNGLWFGFNADTSVGLASQTATARMVILSDGKVGIGTTGPEEKLHVVGQGSFENVGNTHRGNLILGPQGSGSNKWATLAGTHYNEATGSGNGSGNAGIMMIGSHAQSGSNTVYIGHGPYELNPATQIRLGTHTSDTHSTGGTTHMTIDSAGLVMIGDTAERSGALDAITRLQVTGGEAVMGIKNTTATDASYRVMIGFTDNSNTSRGYIATSNAATTYNTSSDECLKTDFEPIHDAAGRVLNLNPTQFKWLDSGNISEGFVAQEVARDEQLAKDVVAGEDGSMVMDYGRITPLLTAALQNALKRIDDLEKEIKGRGENK